MAASLHQYVPIEEPEEPDLEPLEPAAFSVPPSLADPPMAPEGEPVPVVDPLAGLEPVGHGDLYIAFNAHADQVTLGLPEPPQGATWHRLADTNLPVHTYFVGEGEAIHAPPLGAPDV